MVRRWRNQGDTRHRVSQARDQVIHLTARQLAAFTRLGTLSHLDLHNIGATQVLSGHTETTGSHLFDLGTLVSAVTGRVFAALTGVGTTTQRVHGHGQSLVRLRRQGTERHRRRVKTRENILHWLNVAQVN